MMALWTFIHLEIHLCQIEDVCCCFVGVPVESLKTSWLAPPNLWQWAVPLVLVSINQGNKARNSMDFRLRGAVTFQRGSWFFCGPHSASYNDLGTSCWSGARWKGLFLVGGEAQLRWYPLTHWHTSQYLLPIYDKRMIYYPSSSCFYARPTVSQKGFNYFQLW